MENKNKTKTKKPSGRHRIIVSRCPVQVSTVWVQALRPVAASTVTTGGKCITTLKMPLSLLGHWEPRCNTEMKPVKLLNFWSLYCNFKNQAYLVNLNLSLAAEKSTHLNILDRDWRCVILNKIKTKEDDESNKRCKSCIWTLVRVGFG